MASKRYRPYFYCTWLTPLLSGEDSCEWKVWMKAHYQGLNKIEDRGFDSAQWNENHTAFLNELREEYRGKCERILVEGQTSWKIPGKTADVAGKMDLITIGPNMIIDAKTGKQKDAHVMQMKLYLLAVELGVVPGVSNVSKAVLRYPGGRSVEVSGGDDVFKQRFFDLVVRLVGSEPETVPSLYECRFCDLADCKSRVGEQEEVLAEVGF